MLVGQLQGKVGVAPGTTTLTVPGVGQEVFICGAETMSYEEYLATDIKVRREVLDEQKRTAFWSRLGTVATASLASLAVIAGVAAWLRTGRIEAFTNRRP